MTSIDITTAATTAKPTTAKVPSRRKTKAQSASNAAASQAWTKPASKQTFPISKSAIVIKLLSRAKGATVEELMAETSWQPHSVRAYFSGLRKKGHALIREQRKSGEHAYRLGAVAAAAGTEGVTEAAAVPSAVAVPANTDA